MKNPDHHHSGSEISDRPVTFSGSLVIEKNPNPEVKVDVRDDTIPAKTLDQKSPFRSMARTASTKMKKVSHKVKKLATFNRRPPSHLSGSPAVNALKGLRFISQKDGGGGWAAMEERFDRLQINGTLHRSQFCECINMKKDSTEFAEKLFDTLARKQNIDSDSITKAQLKIFLEQTSDQSTRLQTFFHMIDKDADGKITEAEITEIISLSASTNKLDNVRKQAKEYAALIMRELDRENLGYIEIETLELLLLQATTPSSSSGGSSKSLSRMLSEHLETKREGKSVARMCASAKYFAVDNWRRIWVMALWIGVMCGLFAYKYVQYRSKAAHKVMGECVCMAKGAAETLKLNMALILLPVCRNTITWLRNNTKLASFVPFDDNLNFHQMIAIGIGIGTTIHTVAHMSCDFPRLIHASGDKYKPMEPFFGHHQQKSYFHFVKSVEGVTGIVMVVIMAIAFTLAAPCCRTNNPKKPKLLKKLTGFNAFWYSHHLFVIVYALLIVHGFYLYLIREWYKKTTWMYLAVPVTLYGCERIIRAFRSSVEVVTTIKASIYPGNVLALKMTKPEGFTYKSGQYMFIKCKAVSPFEWHPFSITSSPLDDYLSVHIRDLGDWTGRIKTVFSKVCLPQLDGKSGLITTTDCSPKENILDYPKVWIDGPYGAPAQEYKQYEVLLLVGLGIGATPMISIVKDIVNNMKAMDSKKHEIGEFMTRRVYFYWLTREQGSFQWFENVIKEVGELGHNDVIEMHNHCTSVYEEGDFRSVLLAILQDINHARDGLDIVSGTRVKSHFGRPNWDDVYEGIANNHPDTRVGVFYCGAATLVKELKHLASDFSHKTTTKFEFHKENF